MTARILAPVALLLCLAVFFAWRATSSAPRLEAPSPGIEEQVVPAAAAEPLTASTRAPVLETGTPPTDSDRSGARSGCTIHGQVVDQRGAPVSRHDVWLRAADRRTPVYFSFLPEGSGASIAQCDSDGRFTFEGVASGTWWVGPSTTDGAAKQPDDQIAPVGQVLVIHEAMHEVDVLIQTGRGLYLRGVLLDRRGVHVMRGLVLARDLESGLQRYTSVNKAGLFDLGPLRPGRYEVSGWSREADAPSEPIRANAGEEGLQLRMRPGASMSGNIADESGTRVFASLRVASRGSNSFPSPVLESLRDGSFRVPGLEPGDYDVVATTNTGRVGAIGPVVLVAGDAVTDLAISIAPGGTVRVRFSDREPVGFAQLIQGGKTIASIELPRNTVQDFTAMPGTADVRIELLETGRILQRSCDVKVGETTKVLFDPDEH